MIRILHFSDIHIDSRWKTDTSIVVQAFLRDLRALAHDHPIDLAVFSGDLTFSAADDQFVLAADLLDEIRSVVGLEREHFVLTHGNHDNDIRRINKYAENGMRESLKSRDDVNRLLDDNAEIALNVRPRIEAWQSFLATFYSAAPPLSCEPLSQIYRFDFGGTTIAIASLDSAWRATGRPDDDDQHHLLVGDRQIQAAADCLRGADIRIVSMHHPLNWLAPFDAADVRRVLERDFDILLTGHTHLADPAAMNFGGGGYIHSQAGSLYETREHLNSYTILEIDSEKGICRLVLRTFQPRRQEFDVAVDALPGGSAVLPLPKREGVLDRSLPSAAAARNEEAATAILDLARSSSILVDLLAQRTVRTIDDIFVEPPFLPAPYAQYAVLRDGETGKRPDPPNVLSELEQSRCLVVVGEETSGLTSSLMWILLKAHENTPELTPVLVNVKSLKPGKDPIDKAARMALFEAEVPVHPKEDLPPLLLGIDDLDASTPEKVQARIARYLSGRPGDYHVIGCRQGEESHFLAALKTLGVNHSVCFIGPFGRRQLRELIYRVDEERGARLLAAITDLMAREGLARTPFVMSALVTVISNNETLTLSASETAVIDGYASLLLGRSDAAEDSRLSMDYRDREHVLGCLAEQMVSLDTAKMSRIDVARFLIDYFMSVGWSEPPDSVIDSLVQRRILTVSNSGISFRQTALLELFAAKRMIDDPQFRSAILRQPLAYGPIIRHAAALKRNDRALLLHVSEILPKVAAADDTFDAPIVPVGWSEENSIDELVAELSIDGPADAGATDEEPMSPPEDLFDEVWDAFTARTRANSSVAAPVDQMQARERFDISLELVSAVLRNSELVSDTALKERLLKEVLGCWAKSPTMLSSDETYVRLIRETIESLFSRAESKPYSTEEIQDLTRRVAMTAPIYSAFVRMGQSLSSTKITSLLSKVLQDADFMSRMGPALMAALLAYRTKHAGWTVAAKAVAEAHGSNGMVQETLNLICSAEYFDHGKLSTNEVRDLEDVLVAIAKARLTFRTPIEERRVIAGLRDGLRHRRNSRLLIQRGSMSLDGEFGEVVE